MKIFLFILLFFPAFLLATTFESDHLMDLLPYVEKETWVFIDVDNTLLESELQLGSAQWRGYIREKAKNAGYNKEESEEVLDKFWQFVQWFIPVKVVDPKTGDFINQLHKKRIVAVALTAREPVEASHTLKQLSSLDVYLENPQFKDFTLTLPYPCIYDRGVIYAGENKKSSALEAFLAETKSHPKKIIFVDDRWEQVKEVEKKIEGMGIAFIGMRFSGSDERVKAFNAEIADLQWGQLPKIISDQEAKSLLPLFRDLRP